jgi:undecaprenyl-diphosphatase
MDLLHTVIFGIVEGITEFLPISSTGHLVLTARILGLEQTEFQKSFEIVIQLGAILSVVVLYWKSLLFNREIAKRVVFAFIPTGIIGLSLYRVVKKVFLASDSLILWSLLVGGVMLILFEIIHKEGREPIDDMASIPYRTSFFIGLWQSLAMIPGVSRSAATIVGGLILGVKRKTIVEFSFLLAVPTMLAAAGFDLYKNIHTFSLGQLNHLFWGFAVSFFAALLSVKFLLAFIKNHTFILFGAYRIALVLLFWLVMALK